MMKKNEELWKIMTTHFTFLFYKFHKLCLKIKEMFLVKNVRCVTVDEYHQRHVHEKSSVSCSPEWMTPHVVSHRFNGFPRLTRIQIIMFLRYGLSALRRRKNRQLNSHSRSTQPSQDVVSWWKMIHKWSESFSPSISLFFLSMLMLKIMFQRANIMNLYRKNKSPKLNPRVAQGFKTPKSKTSNRLMNNSRWS